MAKTRAYGADCVLLAAFEASYGTLLASGYTRLSFKDSTLGAERPLGYDPLLGQGRDAQDPYRALITKGLVLYAILAWEGIGDGDGLALVTPATIEAFIDGQPILAQLFHPPISSRSPCWTRKKTPPLPRPLALGRRERVPRRRTPLRQGAQNGDGARCPSVEHAPLTVEGWQAWDQPWATTAAPWPSCCPPPRPVWSRGWPPTIPTSETKSKRGSVERPGALAEEPRGRMAPPGV